VLSDDGSIIVLVTPGDTKVAVCSLNGSTNSLRAMLKGYNPTIPVFGFSIALSDCMSELVM